MDERTRQTMSGAGRDRESAQPRTAHRQERRARQARRSALPRAFGLTALSAILPGAGLIGTRRRAWGIALVALVLLTTLALALYAVMNGLTNTALETASSTDTMRVIAGVLVGVTVIWIAAVALTALLARPRRMTTPQRIGLTAFTGVLCLLVAAPAAIGVRYVSATVQAVDEVFSSPTGIDGEEPTSVLHTDPEDPWKDLPRVNMLLLGSDAADGRDGTRTDTMMVLSVDTRTGNSVLFSVPRNLQQVPIPRDLPLHRLYPEGFDCGNECLMNAIWHTTAADVHDHPEEYDDGQDPNAAGLHATQRVLETTLGIELHHTVIINLDGFEQMVDAMGGVMINVQDEIPIGGRTYTDAAGHLQLDPNSNPEWLQPGPQRLDGRQALGFARSRVTSDDFSRMRRQRCMVAAMVDQANPMSLLQRYPQIMAAVGDNVVTDLPRTDLDEWAKLALEMQDGTMKSLPFTGANTDTADPNFSEIRARVYDALFAEPVKKPASTGDDDEQTATATAEPTTDGATSAEETTSQEPVDELEDVAAVCD